MRVGNVVSNKMARELGKSILATVKRCGASGLCGVDE